MRGNAYLSRPVGSKEPARFNRPARIVQKPVYIGQHAPTDHFAPAVKRYIPQEELYVPRKQRDKRR